MTLLLASFFQNSIDIPLMKTHFLFKIITQTNVDINMPEKEMLKYPVHEHYMVEAKEIVVIYKAHLTKRTEENMDAYIEYLKGLLKRKYRAYSVEFGQLQTQLK